MNPLIQYRKLVFNVPPLISVAYLYFVEASNDFGGDYTKYAIMTLLLLIPVTYYLVQQNKKVKHAPKKTVLPTSTFEESMEKLPTVLSAQNKSRKLPRILEEWNKKG